VRKHSGDTVYRIIVFNPRGQRGFTLLEVLCSFAFIGLIGAVLSVTVAQTQKTTLESGARIVAVSDIESAGLSFSTDVRMAQATDLPAGEGTASTVTLTWLDRYHNANEVHTISYALTGSELRRTYDGDVRTVARDVASILFWQVNDTVYMTVVSSPRDERPDLAVQATYASTMRAV